MKFEIFEQEKSGSRWFWVVGTKDYPRVLSWGQKSKALGYLLCNPPRLKRKDRFILGGEIVGIKSKKWILFVWIECLDCTKVGGEVLGKFHHRRHGKI